MHLTLQIPENITSLDVRHGASVPVEKEQPQAKKKTTTPAAKVSSSLSLSKDKKKKIALNRSSRVAYFKSSKNYYARQGPLVVRAHKDGYFRRHKHLPTQVLSPKGPSDVASFTKNELRRGLFLKPTKV